ncbi:hypothetical protein CMI37_25750 [Candidatus Pacearchaeota archaeon]|nr:hypothetical protein [Candidatus Pacearchaeota archaeon]|tara:strand:- start:439 stop:672 length:234 start_codon:yes stop_codon:yes gene_type:complete
MKREYLVSYWFERSGDDYDVVGVSAHTPRGAVNSVMQGRWFTQAMKDHQLGENDQLTITVSLQEAVEQFLANREVTV